MSFFRYLVLFLMVVGEAFFREFSMSRRNVNNVLGYKSGLHKGEEI